MKKIFVLTLNIITLIAILLTGCNTDSLLEYKKAAEKTDGITRGQTSAEFTTTTELNTAGMTEEEIKELNYYKDLKGSFSTVFDSELKKEIYKIYFNTGGIGFDFDLYINGNEVFVKLPVVGKYLNLKDVDLESTMNVNEEKIIISDESVNAIGAKWIGLLKKDDVFKGKDIVLTTPDGEVKTTEYTINLNDEQIKTLFVDVIDIVYQDENLKSFYEEYIEAKIKENADKIDDAEIKNISYEEMLNSMKENIDFYHVEKFNYTAHVDIDGYIVNEKIELSVKVDDAEQKSLSGLNFKLDINNWDINKQQEFNYPTLTDENTLKIEDEESMPNIMQDIFNKE